MSISVNGRDIAEVYLGSPNTNCITSVPKNINLTLSNGVLTLKAGSKVYVPNGKNSDGSNRFDEVVIDSDRTITNTFTGTYSDIVVLYDRNVNGFRQFPLYNSASSGETDLYPTTGNRGWYDTPNNKIKYYQSGNTTVTSDALSFPFCRMRNIGSQGFVELMQVFDWCGYIGSTAFVLPGVKVLVPNGFNDDGTYKNIEVITDKVELETETAVCTDVNSLWMASYKGIHRTNYLGSFKTAPTIAGSWGTYLNTSENRVYYNHVTYWGLVDVSAPIARISYDASGKITSMTPATVQPETTCIEIGEIYNGNDLVFSAFKSQTFTFNASASLQTFVVPRGCTHLDVDCVGSQGGGSYGGRGGRVRCRLSVTPGEVLYVAVGAMDNSYNAADIRTNNAGFTNTTSLQSRLVVAGGGGRAGWNNGAGGAGGGTTGAGGGTAWGDSYGGGGGTQSSGGAGGGHGNVFGYNGTAGSFGLGGGGTGGAGWYGGGSGGAGWYVGWEADRVGGGGGGSSYTNPSRCTNVSHTQGYMNGAGYIKITTLKIK